MSKVITFSRVFPSYHPRKGEPTYFVEKILYGLIKNNIEGCGTELLKHDIVNIKALNPDEIKSHTIRAGHRWKVGDKFSPRVLGNDVNPKNGKTGPYHSKQIIIAPDIEIKKIWNFEVIKAGYLIDGIDVSYGILKDIAANDGLSMSDLETWFLKEMKGQIICWNENINY